MKKPTKSPLKDPPVRNPGQSIDSQRLKLVGDRVITPLIAATLFGVTAIQEWLRYFTPRPPMPWFFTALFLATAGFFLYRVFRTRPVIRRLKQARDGERAVGQYLERLRADGYEVFHDLIGDGFNVDHVLIGPAGVFTVETKSYSKPASGPAEISFDGEQVSIGGWQPNRNPVIQARAQAGWLRALLRETTGRDYAILPVIVYPGWFVKQDGRPKTPLWVLDPKALPQFLKNRDPNLGQSDIKLAAYHLSRFIRAHEREQAKKCPRFSRSGPPDRPKSAPTHRLSAVKSPQVAREQIGAMKGVFTTRVIPDYDDLPERQYHFPRTYLRQVERCVGDWIVYYEPRRSSGDQPGGRQVDFATAQITDVRPDPAKPDHFYADVQGYFEFPHAVPFREGRTYYESLLRRDDGQTNRGAFGRAVRGLPDDEYWAILQAGIASDIYDEEADTLLAQPKPRESVETFLNRKVRDPSFRRLVRQAYDLRCAVSGLRLINGGGRPEVQAAHIRPVEHNGPDTVRNGIALSGTVHWVFDRGLISFGDDGSILTSPHGLPDDMNRLIRSERRLLAPDHPAFRPHPGYLAWHREHQFKR